MNEQKHIINKDVLELTVPDRAHALPIQNKASEVVKYKLNPALDKLFWKISSPDEIIRIDRLVIDIGSVQSDKIDETVLKEVIRQAEFELTRLIREK